MRYMPHDCPSKLPGDSFQTAVWGQVLQTKLSGLTELNRGISGFKKISEAKIYEADCQRKGTCTERERERDSGKCREVSLNF